MGADKVSLADAEADAPFTFFLPSDPEANQDNLTQAWWSPGDTEVALIFGNDSKVEILMSPATTDDPSAAYRQTMDQINAGSIQTVQGQPALVIKPGTDYPGTNPAWVEVMLDGVDINLESHALSDADLLQIASSLAPA